MSALKKAFTGLRHNRSGSNSPATQSDTESSGPPRVDTSSTTATSDSAATSNTLKSPMSGGGSPRHSLDFLGRASKDGGHRNLFKSDDHHRKSSPFRRLSKKVVRRGSDTSHSSTEDVPMNRDGEPASRNQQRKHEQQIEREKHRKEAEERIAADRARKLEMERKALEDDTPEMRAMYGNDPVNNYASLEKKENEFIDIRSLSLNDNGKVVVFRARIHNMRKLSAHLLFLELRQQTATIQGILQEHGSISPHFLYWAEHLHVETIVRVRGVVQEPKAKAGEVKSVSIKNLEIHIHEMHVEAAPCEPLPFTVHEAEVTKAETEKEGDTRHRVSDRARWNNRIVDLRTTSAQGIFRIQSGITQAFRSHLDGLGFVEIHTPKLQAAASESGASVFKVDYFGRPAFLAQSPQLPKQMSIAADMRRVFEVGPVFRAENSNTHRHLTEYTGLDLEMAIDIHYHEVLDVLDSTFKAIFNYVYARYPHEIAAVKRQFPHDDLVWLEKTPIIPFAEAIRMLNSTGWLGENGKPLPENEDLGTRDEIQLGKVVKEKLGTDYYVLDKFPASARPFYAMPDPKDPEVTNSFDIFLRGQEILSGGQRIHDPKLLAEKMTRLKMDPKTMQEYMDGFEWGAPPHGGGGIGLERILMLFLQLGDIRNASLFARDPRSLPEKPVVKQLRHPEASTMEPPWTGRDRALAGLEFQPLEKLIANYGDASNTSWLEPKFEIWRDEQTGAAIGFVPHEGFAITVGDPLCHPSQYAKTIAGYLRYIKKERHIKPLWLLCGAGPETVLAEKFDWRTFSVAAEQRVDPAVNPAAKDPEVQRKIRHAEKEGVKLHDIPIGDEVPQDFKDKIDQRVQDWLSHRKGKQVHLTDVHPWQDVAHRQYHYATDKDGTICCLVIMAQLSPDHGWQIKFSLDFPGAPSGAIEHTVLHALKQVAAAGATSATFGGGAMSKFVPGHNLKGTRVKVLSKAYHAVATELRLTAKSEFREKLGATEDYIFVCYPPHGLGPSGVRAILSFFEDEDDAGKV
ncbi:aspartyl-tRNA synthetase [Polychaeton citri CBS 116435]|uniref:aspartate--tRNA ligase n=1 Tax=Polychaeton citri CBS 116435 TaxID=1314669 RepID=A0A9P4Q1W7_9PEZI|nr:aspartyl-tRNA synthetase [Polychaeton citri CBS 116435]